jgi:hypothetical protein
MLKKYFELSLSVCNLDSNVDQLRGSLYSRAMILTRNKFPSKLKTFSTQLRRNSSVEFFFETLLPTNGIVVSF